MTMTIEQATAAVDNMVKQFESVRDDLNQLRKSNCAALLPSQIEDCIDSANKVTELTDNIINNKTQMAERLVEQSASLTSMQTL